MRRRGFLATLATAIIGSQILPLTIKRKALVFRDGFSTYTYVRAVTPLRRGEFVSWYNREAYLVKATFPSKQRVDTYSIAGVAVGNISAGNYGFIQVSGVTEVEVV